MVRILETTPSRVLLSRPGNSSHGQPVLFQPTIGSPAVWSLSYTTQTPTSVTSNVGDRHAARSALNPHVRRMRLRLRFAPRTAPQFPTGISVAENGTLTIVD